MLFLSTILVDFAQTQSEAFFCVDLTGLPNTVEEVSQAQDSDSRLKSKRMKRSDLHFYTMCWATWPCTGVRSHDGLFWLSQRDEHGWILRRKEFEMFRNQFRRSLEAVENNKN